MEWCVESCITIHSHGIGKRCAQSLHIFMQGSVQSLSTPTPRNIPPHRAVCIDIHSVHTPNNSSNNVHDIFVIQFII